MPERSDAKEKKFLTRPLWLANIGKWDAQGIGDSTFAGLKEREVFEIYAPIAERIISDFNERSFSQAPDNSPLIIGVTGSVAVGKSTISNLLKELFVNSPAKLQTQVISTDNFLFTNERLQQNHILHRKGFPESFDTNAIIEFLTELKEGKSSFSLPVYSHETYDIEESYSQFDAPKVLILEGVNILQESADKSNNTRLEISEFLDFSIFIDADENDIAQWYEDRFLDYCYKAESDRSSFFLQFKDHTHQERKELAKHIWNSVNRPNLLEHINPSREFADLILNKSFDHSILSLEIPPFWTSP